VSVIRALLLCAVLATSAHAQDAPRAAGTFQLAEGDILVEGKDGKARAPATGGDVFEGDTITTFPRAEAQLQMADGASLIVRESSKITIAAYVADGGDGDRSLIELARGALRSITGWIGRYNRANYAIRTPLVTIGVRGTDHEPTHLLPGDPRGEPGSYDKVNEGTTFMQTAEGSFDVPRGRAAFRPQARDARARLLASVPGFFRPGRFEQRFESRAREARRTIQERRQARRELARQRGAAGGAKAVRPAQPQKAAPKGARQERKASERPRDAAKAIKDARPSAGTPRPQLRERPQRPRGAKDDRRPGPGRR
jgi:hypothetical protein